MLEVAKLCVSYGSAPALWDVDLRVEAGELVCVVGPNGAGKTTLINTIAGLLRARSGSISFDGADVTRLPAHRFCHAGIAIVPESRRLFTGMTVLENLEIGGYRRAARPERRRTLDEVCTLFPAVREKLDVPAGLLSGGQQQMVAIGRALMARPRLLLLDEPSLGLAPSVVMDMFEAIRRINADGLSVMLVEQNVSLAMAIARRAYVIEEGRIVLDGPAADLMRRPEVRKAYLGLEE
jgi:branched-chain amino acid transport system ATP-binding protein